MSLLLAALLAQAAAPATDEIVVTARKGRCELRFADRKMGDAEFKARAAEWAAGRPVRVIEPRGADHKCLAKIMFRLVRQGVTLAEFVDAPEAP